MQHLQHWDPFWSKPIIIASVKILSTLLLWQQKFDFFQACNYKILIHRLTFVIQWSLNFGRKATNLWFSCVLFTSQLPNGSLVEALTQHVFQIHGSDTMQLSIFTLIEVSHCTSHGFVSKSSTCLHWLCWAGLSHSLKTGDPPQGKKELPKILILKQKKPSQKNAVANITQLCLAGKRETLGMEKLDGKLEVWSQSASSPEATPSLKLAAAELRDLKARLQLHWPVYTLLSLPALLLPLCSDVILSLSAD